MIDPPQIDPPQYERNGPWLSHAYQLETGDHIRIVARNIRRERTGIHATVRIMVNQVVLASDSMNVDKDSERVRLSNSAMRLLSDLDKACWPDSHMKHTLDIFCLGLWDEACGEMGLELLAPSAENTIVKVCGPFVIEGGGTILFAPPGRGKSFTALAMAVSMDAGCNTLWPVKQARAGYVNLERSRDSIRFRLSCINRALGLDKDRPLHFLNQRGRSLFDVYDSLARDIERFNLDVLVLDSLSRAGMGDLKEDATANRGIDALNRLCPTWLALGHTPRAADDHVFGSQMWDAGEDIGVQLLTQMGEDAMGVGLQVTKANDVAIPPMQIIALEWNHDRLAGIRAARRQEFPEIEAGRRAPKIEQAIDYLKLVGMAAAEEVGNSIGLHRSEVSRMLSHSKAIGKKRDGHKMLFFVLTAGED